MRHTTQTVRDAGLEVLEQCSTVSTRFIFWVLNSAIPGTSLKARAVSSLCPWFTSVVALLYSFL